MAQSDKLALDKEPEFWQLKKWEGDAPASGETKTPIEIIEGGRGHSARVTFRRLGAEPESYAMDIPLGEPLVLNRNIGRENDDAHES